MSENNILGVVLAGGKSKRFGEDKSKIKLEGKTLIEHTLDKIDIVLLMSVNPGFGGQSFIESVFDKLKIARKIIDESKYDIRLEIDGGVKVDNIRKIAEAGADTFVAGSAIFGAEDYKSTIKMMREQIALAKN